MKKISILLAVILCATGLFAQKKDTLFVNVQRAAWQALHLDKEEVRVDVRLAKPVYMSDVMFRRPRGKNMVIRVDYKQEVCRGVLAQGGQSVYMPASCVWQGKYNVSQVRLTFADGHQVKMSGKSVRKKGELAYIRL